MGSNSAINGSLNRQALLRGNAPLSDNLAEIRMADAKSSSSLRFRASTSSTGNSYCLLNWCFDLFFHDGNINR